MKATLEKLLEQIQIDADEIIDLTPLTAGLSQQCWTCRTAKGNYIVKLFNSLRSFEVELAVYRELKNDELISKCVASYQSEGENLLLIEEVEGTTISQATTNSKVALEQMTKLLVRFHQKLNPEEKRLETIKKLNIWDVLHDLMEKADLDEALNSSIQRHIERLMSSSIYSATKSLNNVICHGDMNTSNVIGVNNHFKLIDFESASKMPAEYDLAMMLAVNGLDVAQAAFISQVYQKEHSQISPGKKRLQLSSQVIEFYYQVSLIINGLWYFYRGSESELMRQKAHLQWQLLGLQ